MEKLHEKNSVILFCRTGIATEAVQVMLKEDILYVYSIYSARLLFKVSDEDIRVNVKNAQLVPTLEALAKREGLRLIVTAKTLKTIGSNGEKLRFWAWENPIDADDSELVMASALGEPAPQNEGPVDPRLSYDNITSWTAPHEAFYLSSEPF